MVILTGPTVIAEWLGHTRRGDHWRCEDLQMDGMVLQTTVTQPV